jgi:cytochrome c oxidase assembly factor CtaG
MGVWGVFLVSVLLLIVCAGVLALMRRKRVRRESVETPAERYQREVLGLRELRAQESSTVSGNGRARMTFVLVQAQQASGTFPNGS